ncbi:hypothetical protein [Marinoscillum sp. 108]|uniref:hypothetical protein n=1 Tax=Marinoscillum sp. 108 TaxID=2653151 RepID=UPI00135851F6|nr:hypothetical protein [Marinoscillum sp. 108]
MKYGELYLSKYIGFQHRLRKTFKIITFILSLSGILGWKYFQDYAWVILLIICVMQLLSLVGNQLVRSDKEVEEISALKMMYTKYFNKLERLWDELYTQRINDDEALERFYELRTTDWENIEQLDCKLDIKRFKRLMNKTEIETNDYINKYHNYE